MSVNVQLIGRLGNHLFQYALGRIIAERLGRALVCSPLPFEPKQLVGDIPHTNIGQLATLASAQELFPNARLTIDGAAHTEPVQRFIWELGGAWDGHSLDLEALLADTSPRQIVLSGFFQNIDYYHPERERVRRWLAPAPLPVPFEIRPRDIVLNIRRGDDFALLGWTLSLSYYEQVLDSMDRRGARVYVCGVGIDDDVRARLARFDPIYHSATPIEVFSFMARFRRIIQSNSTFSWWASYLSDAEEIYLPTPRHPFMFSFDGYKSVRLLPPEPRFRAVPDASAALYVPFRRNESVESEIAPSAEGWQFVVKPARRNSVVIDFPASLLGLFEELSRRDTPFSWMFFFKRGAGGAHLPWLCRAVAKLVDCGFLLQRPQYEDPADLAAL